MILLTILLSYIIDKHLSWNLKASPTSILLIILLLYSTNDVIPFILVSDSISMLLLSPKVSLINITSNTTFCNLLFLITSFNLSILNILLPYIDNISSLVNLSNLVKCFNDLLLDIVNDIISLRLSIPSILVSLLLLSINNSFKFAKLLKSILVIPFWFTILSFVNFFNLDIHLISSSVIVVTSPTPIVFIVNSSKLERLLIFDNEFLLGLVMTKDFTFNSSSLV